MIMIVLCQANSDNHHISGSRCSIANFTILHSVQIYWYQKVDITCCLQDRLARQKASSRQALTLHYSCFSLLDEHKVQKNFILFSYTMQRHNENPF